MESITPIYRLIEVLQDSFNGYILNANFETNHSVYEVNEYIESEPTPSNYKLTVILNESCSRENSIQNEEYEVLTTSISFKLESLPTGIDAFFDLTVEFKNTEGVVLNNSETNGSTILTQADAENDSKPIG